MKIAFVDTSNFIDYPIGGQLTSVKKMINFFICQEQTSIILIGINKKNKKNCTVKIGNKNISFISVYEDTNDSENPKRSLRLHFMLGLFLNILKIKKMDIDVFFIHNPEAFLPIKIFYRKKKIVTFSHGSFYNIFNHIRFKKAKNALIKKTLKSYLDWVIKKSDVLLVLDKQSMNEYSMLNKNVYLVSNSIDIENYKKSERLDKLDRFIFIGRLSANKRIDVIIKAVSHIENVQLHIYGEGEEFKYLEEIIFSLNLQNRVFLKGSINNDSLIQILNIYDVLILNSVVEGMPMVVLEALASGLAVITTKVGAIPELIKDGENGFFTDGSEESIIEAYKKLKKCDTVKIRKNNFFIAKDYDYRIVNKKIFDIIISLYGA